VTLSFRYETYPQLNIEWDDHALGAALRRLIGARGEEHQQLVWWAAALARYNGYEVHAAEECVDITLPTGVVILSTDTDSFFSPDEQESIDAFCAHSLAGLPGPDAEAMRYGQATFGPGDPFGPLDDALKEVPYEP
jgi:hypothetical protein